MGCRGGKGDETGVVRERPHQGFCQTRFIVVEILLEMVDQAPKLNIDINVPLSLQ